MNTCTKLDGTIVTCSEHCLVPWGCAALPCYDEARMLYVERSREVVQKKLTGPCACGVGRAKDCTPGRCVLEPDTCCGSCDMTPGHLPCDGR